MPDIFVSPTTPFSSPTSPGRFGNGIDHALSAYLFMPEGIRFETQEPGESIILFLRKHWITNALWLLISLFLILIPLFIFPLFVISGNLPPQISSNMLSLFVLIWYMITFSYILVNFLLWYFTISIVTRERIIDIDFINLLNKKFAETRIARIEDVTMRTGGFIRAFFDYGDVHVQTAAKEAVFQFNAVPHPDAVVKIINSLMGKEEEEGELQP